MGELSFLKDICNEMKRMNQQLRAHNERIAAIDRDLAEIRDILRAKTVPSRYEEKHVVDLERPDADVEMVPLGGGMTNRSYFTFGEDDLK